MTWEEAKFLTHDLWGNRKPKSVTCNWRKITIKWEDGHNAGTAYFLMKHVYAAEEKHRWVKLWIGENSQLKDQKTLLYRKNYPSTFSKNRAEGYCLSHQNQDRVHHNQACTTTQRGVINTQHSHLQPIYNVLPSTSLFLRPVNSWEMGTLKVK